jgi:hypothetical protein
MLKSFNRLLKNRELSAVCRGGFPDVIPIKSIGKPGTVDSRPGRSRLLPSAFCLLLSAFCLQPARAQVESVESTAPIHYLWVSHGRIEGHLALSYSPAGAFSPDSSILAVASENKIVLMGVREGSIQKVLKPRIPDITDLNIQSANFLAMNQLFLLGNGVISAKGKGPGRSTPLLAFQWDAVEDRLSENVEAVGGEGGFGPILYFPHIRCVVLTRPVTSIFGIRAPAVWADSLSPT